MTALAANIDASQTLIPVDAGLSNGSFQLPLYYTVDSEAVRVTGRAHRTTWLVERGIAGTTAATHSSAATLTRYYPDGATGGGAIAVTDGTTTVSDVTTIELAGATVSEGAAGVAEVGVVVLKQTVTLTNDQVKALPTTPITVVPAPGPGMILLFLSVHLRCSAAVDYANIHASSNLEITSGGIGGRLEQSVLSAITGLLAPGDANDATNAFISLNQSQFGTASLTGYSGIYDSDIANQPLRVQVNNQAAGDFTGGNAANTLAVNVYYFVVPLA